MPEPFAGSIDYFDPLVYQERWGSESKWTGNVSYDKAAFTIECQVPWLSFPIACIDILGYSQVEASVTKMRRVPPLRHPIFSNLSATQIVNIQGIGRPTDNNFGPMEPTLGNNLQPPYGRHRLVRFTVVFEPLPYGTLTDLELEDQEAPSLPESCPTPDPEVATGTSYPEIQRYVSFAVKPGVEILGVDGHSYKYTCGPGRGTLGLAGHHLTLLNPRSTFELTWWRVPLEWVTTEPLYATDPRMYFANIDRCISRCNDRPFLGYARGELLLDPPLIRTYANPFPTNVEAPSFFPQMLCDIVLPFRAYVPEYGACSDDTTTVGVDESEFCRYGWQTAPWRGDFKSYPIILANVADYPAAPADKPPYREGDFGSIFRKAVE